MVVDVFRIGFSRVGTAPRTMFGKCTVRAAPFGSIEGHPPASGCGEVSRGNCEHPRFFVGSAARAWELIGAPSISIAGEVTALVRGYARAADDQQETATPSDRVHRTDD